jgi:hypothetical protein
MTFTARPVCKPPPNGPADVARGSVFVLRAIGEFRLVGFFKSVRGTPFAHWDTWLYSPLSLLIGLGALWLASTSRPR